MNPITLIGLPVATGGAAPGCLMGPDALRTAGLAGTLRALGRSVEDRGNLTPRDGPPVEAGDLPVYHLQGCADWLRTIHAEPVPAGVTMFLGGDHLMAAGTVPLMAVRAAARGRRLAVLWLDAHSDFHDLRSTTSGNLHGTPAAYFCGRPGFDAFPPPPAAVAPADVCMMGLRSVDPAERARLNEAGIDLVDMRAIDERGVAGPLAAFLDRVAAAGADLHLSLDVDFLDPAVAPAVGTTVPGGATFREAHLIMEMLCDAGLVTSLDLAELNPMLDERGRTARVMVDLVASLFGQRVLDRPTAHRTTWGIAT